MNSKPDSFYASLQRTVREQTDKRSLSACVRKWRYTQSLDDSQLTLTGDSLRFLVRYGVLDAGKDRSELEQGFRQITMRVSRANGDAPGVVAKWIELFAAGEYGLLQSGVCAKEPRCASCGLKETCRYLAAGGKDSRAFGKSLERELLAENRATDLTAADLISFLAFGEKRGAADQAKAAAVLKACQGLRGLFLAKPEHLRELGLPDTAAARIHAAAELCRAWAKEKAPRGSAFTCGQNFYDYFHLQLRELHQEVFVVALLDQKNRLIEHQQISEGSLTETMAHPREVFAQAISKRAAAIAVLHNHPSGDPSPSDADRAITTRLNSVAKIVGIRFLDHIIIGDGRFYSFVEEGELA